MVYGTEDGGLRTVYRAVHGLADAPHRLVDGQAVPADGDVGGGKTRGRVLVVDDDVGPPHGQVGRGAAVERGDLAGGDIVGVVQKGI